MLDSIAYNISTKGLKDIGLNLINLMYNNKTKGVS